MRGVHACAITACVTVCTESNVTGVKCAAIDLICNLRCEFTTLIEKLPTDKLTMWFTVGVAHFHGTSSGWLGECV